MAKAQSFDGTNAPMDLLDAKPEAAPCGKLRKGREEFEVSTTAGDLPPIGESLMGPSPFEMEDEGYEAWVANWAANYVESDSHRPSPHPHA
jgi:hypothetical protein